MSLLLTTVQVYLYTLLVYTDTDILHVTWTNEIRYVGRRLNKTPGFLVKILSSPKRSKLKGKKLYPKICIRSYGLICSHDLVKYLTRTKRKAVTLNQRQSNDFFKLSQLFAECTIERCTHIQTCLLFAIQNIVWKNK